MRSFEMLLIIFNVLLLGWLIFARNKPQRGLLIGFAISAIFMLTHGLVEGIRWQMIPAYVMTFIPIAILTIRHYLKPKEVKKKASPVRLVLITTLAALYSIIAVALPLLLPVFTFDKPTGPYKIGTVTYDWKDEQREETLTPEIGDKRELMVQIWYPTDSTAKGNVAPYIPNADVFAEGYSKILNLPKLLFTTFGYVKTHAIENTDISNQEPAYPVLLFSHGFSGHKNQNTFQIEQLVSQGYIVVGMDHSYSSTASIFSDGRVANYMPQDTNSIAYLNMDGVLYGKLRVPADGLKKPFMMMSADDSLRDARNSSDKEFIKFVEETLPRYEHVPVGGNYWMKINNMKHMGFSDLYLFSPLYEKMEGVDIRKAYRLINDYSLDFFDHYLKQQPFKLLEQNIGDHPEFTLQKG